MAHLSVNKNDLKRSELDAVKYKIKHFIPVLIVISLLITKINNATGEPHPPPGPTLWWAGLPLSQRERGDMPNPILVLATDKHFGSFTSEILRAEGFNE